MWTILGAVERLDLRAFYRAYRADGHRSSIRTGSLTSSVRLSFRRIRRWVALSHGPDRVLRFALHVDEVEAQLVLADYAVHTFVAALAQTLHGVLVGAP